MQAMDSPYAPDVKSRRLIVEQALRELHAALQVREYQMRVERRIASTLGDSGAQTIAQIEADMRCISAQIEGYEEILAELGEGADGGSQQVAQALAYLDAAGKLTSRRQ
jgi:hypothetical protein